MFIIDFNCVIIKGEKNSQLKKEFYTMANTELTKSYFKPALSIKAQALATVLSIASAVALPQLFHAMGALSGLGSSLGEAFLPMHLPIILVGLLAGAYAGAISGIAAPILSFLLSGMPVITMLPFMTIELLVYGLTAGLLRNKKMPTVLKVIIAQLSGRIVRAAAILIAAFAFGYQGISISVIYTSVATGIFGIALQLALIPLIVYRVENSGKSNE